MAAPRLFIGLKQPLQPIQLFFHLQLFMKANPERGSLIWGGFLHENPAVMVEFYDAQSQRQT